jgi:hypothetical protein
VLHSRESGGARVEGFARPYRSGRSAVYPQRSCDRLEIVRTLGPHRRHFPNVSTKRGRSALFDTCWEVYR